MRQIVVHEFISLDGVIQAPGGADEDTDGGFEHGGWTGPYWHDDIGARFFDTMSRADTMLLGRKTWQIHSVFETMDDPFADALNAVKKYVVSTTLTNPSAWRNSSLISGDVVGQVRRLKEQSGGDILMDGSSVLVRTLLEHELIDELQLHVYPVVLGGGKTIWPDGKRSGFELVEAVPLPTGVLFTRYRRAP